MKLIVLLFSIVLTGIFAFSGNEKKLAGTWVMQPGDADCSPAVIRIKMHEGVWEGKLDMPAEEVYDKPIFSIIEKGDSIIINISKSGNIIKAALVNDHLLAGELVSDSEQVGVKFTKL